MAMPGRTGRRIIPRPRRTGGRIDETAGEVAAGGRRRSRRRRRPRRWPPTGFQLVSLLVALALGSVAGTWGVVWLADGLAERRDANESRDWPTTTGHITSSTVEERQVPGGRLEGTESEWEVEVTYDYQVSGRAYHGDRIFSTDTTFSMEYAAWEFASRYLDGQTVTVAYDPDRPSRALLEPGERRHHWLLHAGFGLFFLLVGVGVLGRVVGEWWVGSSRQSTQARPSLDE